MHVFEMCAKCVTHRQTHSSPLLSIYSSFVSIAFRIGHTQEINVAHNIRILLFARERQMYSARDYASQTAKAAKKAKFAIQAYKYNMNSHKSQIAQKRYSHTQNMNDERMYTKCMTKNIAKTIELFRRP